MEQLRLALPPRDAGNPFSRLLLGLGAVVFGLALLAVLILVVLPLVGIIVSAAVGGMILAVAGVAMMLPFLLMTATIFILISRSSARRHAGIRAPTLSR